MPDAASKVVVATCYTMSGAQEVIAELARQGVEARVSDEGVATRIWTGEDVNAPGHFVCVPEEMADDARRLLADAGDLDFVIVDEDAEFEALPDEDGEAALPKRSVTSRALTCAVFSIPFFPLGPFALWYAVKAIKQPIKGEERQRAWMAALLSLPGCAISLYFLLIPLLILRSEFLERGL